MITVSHLYASSRRRKRHVCCTGCFANVIAAYQRNARNGEILFFE